MIRRGFALCCLSFLLLPLSSLADSQPFIVVTTGNANDPQYTSNPGGFYNSVALINIFVAQGTAGCSGALIDSIHVLTAAHCVDPAVTGAITGIQVQFPVGPAYVASSWVYDPLFNINNLGAGNDLGIITLSSAAAGLPYALFAGSGVGSTVDIAGYGVSSWNGYDSGTLRHGQNQFDAGYDSAGNPVSNPSFIATYQYYLDSAGEVMTCYGDSGGPSFINGELAGVHSFGDSHCNSSGFDIGVAQTDNLAFIETYSSASVASVPEPSSLLLLGSTLVAAAPRRRRKERRILV